jgi:ribose transport system substrate-binding protein
MTPIVRPLISLVSSLSLVFGSAAFSLGCSNGHSDSGPVIGGSAPNGGKHQRYALIVKTQQNPVFICMQRGADEAAKKLGVELIPLSPADEKNFQEQVEYVRIATRKKVDAILIAPADSKLLVAPLKEAQDAGIKIINIDNALDPAEMQSQGLKLDAFVGVDNVEGGRLAADFLAKKIGEAGQVAMLEGFVGVANSEQRKQGFKEAIAKYPKIELVAVATGEWYPAKAMEVTQGLLQKYPNLRGLFCANDLMAIGAISAAEQAGKLQGLTIVAYDNLKDVRAALLAGKIAGTIEQWPDWMGAQAVRVAYEIQTKGAIAKNDFRSPVAMISPESLKEKDVKPVGER